MPICFVNPDGSHVRGCDQHVGAHPFDWCRTDRPTLKVLRRGAFELERDEGILTFRGIAAEAGAEPVAIGVSYEDRRDLAVLLADDECQGRVKL